MEFIQLYLLGAPRVERAGQRIEFDTRKAIALLAYLAVSQRPHQRDALAAMFWPEADQNGARAALMRTLSVLRSGLGEGALSIKGIWRFPLYVSSTKGKRTGTM